MQPSKLRNIIKYYLMLILIFFIAYILIINQSSYKKLAIIEKSNNTFVIVEIKEPLNINDLYSLADKIYTNITENNLYKTNNVVICFTDDKEYNSAYNIKNLTIEEIENKSVLGTVNFNKIDNQTKPQVENNLIPVDWNLKPTIDDYNRYNDFKTYLRIYKKNFSEIDTPLSLSSQDLIILEKKFKMSRTEIEDLINKVDSWRNNYSI